MDSISRQDLNTSNFNEADGIRRTGLSNNSGLSNAVYVKKDYKAKLSGTTRQQSLLNSVEAYQAVLNHSKGIVRPILNKGNTSLTAFQSNFPSKLNIVNRPRSGQIEDPFRQQNNLSQNADLGMSSSSLQHQLENCHNRGSSTEPVTHDDYKGVANIEQMAKKLEKDFTWALPDIVKVYASDGTVFDKRKYVDQHDQGLTKLQKKYKSEIFHTEEMITELEKMINTNQEQIKTLKDRLDVLRNKRYQQQDIQHIFPKRLEELKRIRLQREVSQARLQTSSTTRAVSCTPTLQIHEDGNNLLNMMAAYIAADDSDPEIPFWKHRAQNLRSLLGYGG